MKTTITESLANEILTAEAGCYDEGTGPVSDEYYAFIESLGKAFPRLKEKFRHIRWERFARSSQSDCVGVG